jgi:hypothetical protein
MNDAARVLALVEAFPGRPTVTLQKLARDLAGLPSASTKQVLFSLVAAGHIHQVDRSWSILRPRVIGPDALDEYRIMGGLAVDNLIDASQCGVVEWHGSVRTIRSVIKHRMLQALSRKVMVVPLSEYLAETASSCRPPESGDLAEYMGPELDGYLWFDHEGTGSYADRWVEPKDQDGMYRLCKRNSFTEELPKWIWRVNGRRYIAESDQGQLLCYHLANGSGRPISIPFYHERSLLMVSWLPRSVYQCLIALGAERVASEPTAEKPWTGFSIPRGQVNVSLDLLRTMLTAKIEDL